MIDNTVIYTMKRWVVDDTAVHTIGYDGESNVTELEIQADYLPANLTYFLDIFDLIDRDYVQMERTGDVLHILLSEGMLGAQGLKTLQIRAVGDDGETVKKSNCFHAVVERSVNATEEYSDPLPSAFEQYETRIRAMYNDLSGVTGWQFVNRDGHVQVFVTGGAYVVNDGGNLVFGGI